MKHDDLVFAVLPRALGFERSMLTAQPVESEMHGSALETILHLAVVGAAGKPDEADGHGKGTPSDASIPGQHWLPAHQAELPGHCTSSPALQVGGSGVGAGVGAGV
eukprot:CAMPEP_0115502300 /NCGR_PEP_ID=MMETSP0271-20121206/68866_1 /TAXON_ID=71861 /ORGANISM="Scrippsiella trochoidea, Strain CCMP3099" /LENGTH=105 /DNA_ID=CAMNT_0002931309 /DNA_START=28 /DNA_END=343 /DNA_ORIENTATION=-